MYCFYHPEREPVASCVKCGQLICAECKVILNGKVHCNPCANRLFSVQTTPIVPKHENWFERHLNWTFIITLIAMYPLDYFAGFILGSILYSIDPLMTEETAQAFAVFICLILNVVIICSVGIWVLKKKAKSAWDILLLIVPFGLIFFLCLDNQQKKLSKITSSTNSPEAVRNAARELEIAKNAARAIIKRGSTDGYKYSEICASLKENPGDPEAMQLLNDIILVESDTLNSVPLKQS